MSLEDAVLDSSLDQTLSATAGKRDVSPRDAGEHRSPIPSVQHMTDGIELQGQLNEVATATAQQGVYSILPEREKGTLMIIASFAAVISPFATGLFYPTVNALAKDLDKSVSLINLSISTYQICQAIAPSFTAAVSERYGRRPAYLMCIGVYLCANVGLALQNNYAALMTLRMVQSAGSSGTMALAQGVIGDLGTRAERGKYIAYATIGAAIGPLLGPTIGGLLTTYLGWRAVFWFLVIFSAVIAVLMIAVFRETNRSIVGDSSVAPPRWNMSLLQLYGIGTTWSEPDPSTMSPRPARLNPFSSLIIYTDRSSCIQCLYGGLLFAGFSATTAILTSQLADKFSFTAVKIGLCYLPPAFGAMLSRWTTAKFIDWNFKRELVRQGLPPIEKGKQQDITNFNVEKARLVLAPPLIALVSAFIIAFGFLMAHRLLVPTLVVLTLLSNVATSLLIMNAALLMDVHRDRTASVGAALNLSRCLLSAGLIAISTPLIDRIGLGPFTCLIAAVWVVFAPGYMLVYYKGFAWRKTKARNAMA